MPTDNMKAWYLNVDGTNIQEQRLPETVKQCEYAAQNQNGEAIFELSTDGLLDGTPENQGYPDAEWDWVKDAVENAVCEDTGVAGAGEGASYYENYPCTELRTNIDPTDSGKRVFRASARGFGCDNPRTDPYTLNDIMMARAVMFNFVDTECLEFDFNAEGDVSVSWPSPPARRASLPPATPFPVLPPHAIVARGASRVTRVIGVWYRPPRAATSSSRAPSSTAIV